MWSILFPISVELLLEINQMKLFFFLLVTFIVVSCGSGVQSSESYKHKIVLKIEEASQGGQKFYFEHCKVCHGTDGKRMLAGAADLSVSEISIDERIKIISFGKTSGKAAMPGFKNLLNQNQIAEIATYLDELKTLK
jgi:cytochrome c553